MAKGGGPILLLVNYRPEYSHQRISQTYCTQLRLGPLGKESAEQILSGLLGNGKDLVAVLPFVLKRLGFDPASASAPFVATLVDVTGLVIRQGGANHRRR